MAKAFLIKTDGKLASTTIPSKLSCQCWNYLGPNCDSQNH